MSDSNIHSDSNVLPELKEIAGAVLFAAKTPVTVSQIRKVLRQTAERYGEHTRDFAKATDDDIRAAMEDLIRTLNETRPGFRAIEVAEGYRLENVPRCGPWIREYLEKGKPARLSQPALETMAVIAYRQPCTRAQIESVRGVAVDALLRTLLDLQLIKIVGRSELPGRPWLFGTTQKFLEHFGLRSVGELPDASELGRIEEEKSRESAVVGEDAPAPVLAPTAEPPPPEFREGSVREPPAGADGDESAAAEAGLADAVDTSALEEGVDFDESGEDEDEEAEDEEEFDEDEFDDDEDEDECDAVEADEAGGEAAEGDKAAEKSSDEPPAEGEAGEERT